MSVLYVRLLWTVSEQRRLPINVIMSCNRRRSPLFWRYGLDGTSAKRAINSETIPISPDPMCIFCILVSFLFLLGRDISTAKSFFCLGLFVPRWTNRQLEYPGLAWVFVAALAVSFIMRCRLSCTHIRFSQMCDDTVVANTYVSELTGNRTQAVLASSRLSSFSS